MKWPRFTAMQNEHVQLHVHVVVASGADPRKHRAGLVTDAFYTQGT